MKFRLFYSGDLKPKGSAGLEDIHSVRKCLHPQLKQLWSLDPLNQLSDVVVERNTYDVGGIKFRPAISEALCLSGQLDVLFLRPRHRRDILIHGADIDNRMKTLLDALRIPDAEHIEQGELDKPKNEEVFYVLLRDDSLVTKVSFEADRLLGEMTPNQSVVIVEVTTVRSRAMAFNDILG